MSFARFGPESDVYVYLDFFGRYVVHVALRRRVVPVKPGPFDDESYEVIEGPYTDTDHTLASASETIALLTSLREAGYLVPQYTLDRLGEEPE